MNATKEYVTPAKRKRGRHGRTPHRSRSSKMSAQVGRSLTRRELKKLRSGVITFDPTGIRLQPYQKLLYRRAEHRAKQYATAS